jgi:hypothetical protein
LDVCAASGDDYGLLDGRVLGAADVAGVGEPDSASCSPWTAKVAGLVELDQHLPALGHVEYLATGAVLDLLLPAVAVLADEREALAAADCVVGAWMSASMSPSSPGSILCC